MSNSSVPPIAFTPAGLTTPAAADVLAGVQADMNAAFGGNLSPSLFTPQGQLASSEAAIIEQNNALFAQFMSQIDPATASGRMQDAIGRIYSLSRLPATPTAAQVLCSGLAGTVIPVGALAADQSGNLYACTAAGTIPVGGSITLPFAAVINGPLSCGAGAINTIYQRIIGLDSVTNVAAGVLGTYVESRADFEYRRQQSVAINALGSLPSIYAAIFGVAGVTDVYAIQNVTDAPVVNGAITLLAHSIYIAVAGGLDADVANAIWRKVSNGCNYNGNTTVTVQDTSGYAIPIPTYAISFQRPTDLPFYFAVTVQNLGALSNAAVAPLIQTAIISAFTGGDGGQRARIGSTIFASRFFAAIASVTQLAIISVTLGTAPAPVGTSLTAGINQKPTLIAANISVAFV